ncbi:MAG: fibronectin type III domain-containing protein [Dehalococcoidia bacterium]
MSHAFGLAYHSSNDPWNVLSDVLYWQPDPNSQGRIAAYCDALGWIPDSRKVVDDSGSQQVTLNALSEAGASGMLMARIPIPNTQYFYSVEFRKATGYDLGLPGAAVVIHKIEDQVISGRHYFVPATVIASDPNGGETGTMWESGQTYADTANNIVIRIDSISGSTASITINLTGPAPSPTPTPTPTATSAPTPSPTSAPSVSAPTSLNGTANGATSANLTWDASASSVDSYNLAYQPYNSGQWTTVTVSDSMHAATVSGLQAGSWYQFKVQACKVGQCSSYSAVLLLETYAS